MIHLSILGNNSALPAYDRWPTAQLVQIRDQHFLVDCGEGTQIRLQQMNIGWAKIKHIFISHLHGDHYYGLIGLVTTMNLLGRKQDLHIYGPPELEEILHIQISISGGSLNYTLHFHPIDNNGLVATLMEDKYYKVSCFPVAHRIPCHGFIFTAKHSGRKLLPEQCEKYNIPTAYFQLLKEGHDYIAANGQLIKNEIVTSDPLPELKYAYCADTLYHEEIVDHIKGCHTIYHESTFLEVDEQKAIDRYHSTTTQAACIAQKAQVKRLLLGHYSSRYESVDIFEEEARQIFEESYATKTGSTYEIKH